ncbi:hypothetical protein T265_09070 [Opisthorchis viverrini]|uniref:Leucine Rich repeat-containing domain protein n=1 Tax=Opisthorchis viverrini TaxID=6198 RepID=A0A074ZI15_OPIVI|nr:hypothetical protein T265_09070 [Opisthorchis viverrini]KER22940.1 hypothetical protein T265_09070 [Opisthorchis viverrini]
MSTGYWEPHRCRLEWVLFLIYLSSVLVSVKSDCQAHPSFIACTRAVPRLTHLVKAGQLSHVMITQYDGELSTDIPEGYGNYTVKSLQVSKSRITNIQPRFFARLSNNKLSHLTLSAVNGTLHLDSGTLGGLESVLHTLYVSDPVLQDVSYLAKLSQLDQVSLVRTSLAELPPNFVTVLRHVIKLDLSSNQLTTLPWSEVAKRIADITFSEIKLANNRWHCDCGLRPLVVAPLEAKRKVANFECSTPADLADLPLQALTVESICPETPELPVDKRPSVPGWNTGVVGGNDAGTGSDSEPAESKPNYGNEEQPLSVAQGEEAKLATAGGMSTEVIAVIIAIVVVVAIVLIAVIVFKVRSKNQRQRKQDGDKPSHKSSTYCHVIEHPNSKQAGRNSGTNNSGAPAAPGNSYNRDLEDSERQPLAPPYYSRDPRL